MTASSPWELLFVGGLGQSSSLRRLDERQCEKRRRCRVLARGVGEQAKRAKFWEGSRNESSQEEEEALREDCNWGKVESLVQSIGEMIVDEEVDVVLGITRGGMVPAVLLCQKFQLRSLMSATVMFYTDSGSRFYGLTDPTFLHFPEDQLIEGRRILIVDDVWDTGRTARSVRERVTRAGGEAKIAVLHYKPLRNQFPEDKPEFFAETTDNWIIYPWEKLADTC